MRFRAILVFYAKQSRMRAQKATLDIYAIISKQADMQGTKITTPSSGIVVFHGGDEAYRTHNLTPIHINSMPKMQSKATSKRQVALP